MRTKFHPGVVVLILGIETLALLSTRTSALSNQDSAFGHDEATRLALGRTIAEVRYENTPLDQVIDDLRKRLGINIHVHWAELDDCGVKKNSPIRARLKHVSAGRLLRLVLETFSETVSCTYEIRDGVVVVSTESAQHRMVLRTYMVRDLLHEGEWTSTSADPLRKKIEQRLGLLGQTITDSIQPDAWVQGGGLGTLAPVDGIIFVRNTADVHRELKGLFAAIRTVPKQGTIAIQPEVRPTAANEKIRNALNRRLPSIQFENVPFGQVVEWLSDMIDINMHVMWDTLGIKGAPRGHPVSLNLRDRSAAAALRLTLDDLTRGAPWGFEIDDGILVIAGAEFLYRRLFVHVYEVADLTRARIEPEALTQLLADTVDPDSWVQGGGLGTLRIFRDRLVVRNNVRVQREVARVLGLFRNAAPRGNTKTESP